VRPGLVRLASRFHPRSASRERFSGKSPGPISGHWNAERQAMEFGVLVRPALTASSRQRFALKAAQERVRHERRCQQACHSDRQGPFYQAPVSLISASSTAKIPFDPVLPDQRCS
jgi:hypothetical protein